jgi:hypothetical protein
VSKPASRRTLGSDLARVDGHVVRPSEYKELTELTDDMLARAVVKKGGRPRSANARPKTQALAQAFPWASTSMASLLVR